MGNREFQWRVKKVDGAFDALLSAGFIHLTDPAGPTSPTSSSPSDPSKVPREYLLWKADGQVGAGSLILGKFIDNFFWFISSKSRNYR
jgi:hypothetical protein